MAPRQKAEVSARSLAGLQKVQCHYSEGGLAVTTALSAKEGPYCVTHLKSGKRVARINTIKQGRALIAALLPLTDWTRPQKVLRRVAGLYDALAATRDRVLNGETQEPTNNAQPGNCLA